MRALRNIMVLGFAVVCVAISASEPSFSRRLDRQVTKHYEAACTAYHAGDYHRALAEIDLVLLPKTSIFLDCPKDSTSYAAAMTGIQIWEDALGEDSPFTVVDKKDKAQIIISFPKTACDDSESICGHVTWRRKAIFGRSTHTAFVTAEIQVGIEARGGHVHDSASLVHIVAHEIGHVLGLDDTQSPFDIMGPDMHGSASVKLSEGEMKAIIDLRAKCHTLRTTVDDAKELVARNPQR